MRYASGRGVVGSDRQRIRGALGLGLPLTFDLPRWVRRFLTPGEACWSGEPIDRGDSAAVEFVSISGSVVTLCGTCFGYWRLEAAERRAG